MKRCPQCSRTYTDESLNFCLDDGEWLAAGDDPQTAILHEPAVSADGISRVAGVAAAGSTVSEQATKVFSSETDLAAGPTAQIEKETQRPAGELSTGPSPFPKYGIKVLAALVAAVAVLAGGFYGYRYFGSGGGQIGSVAVMPFVNESGNPDLEYLSDGMTESLIRSLAQLPNLNVKSRSSVFRYKGKETDAKSVGNELGVQAVLNGRLTQRGDQLTLDLELINTETENVIWTDEYDRRSSDLVSLQNEIARDVSNKLKVKLSGADQQRLAKSYTNDPEAYRLYLQGRFYWNKRSGKEFEKAEGYFRQAVEKDPGFALGYVGLADTNEDEDRPAKKEYIRRALELDDQLAEAHASLGYQCMLDYDWAASERELKRAMELNPNYAQAYGWNGARLMMLGKYDESLAAIRKALEIDPTSTGINFYLGVCLLASGKTDESIQQLKMIAATEPTFSWTHTWLSRIYRQTGNRPASVEERAKALELEGKFENARQLRESFANGGWNAYLNEWLRLGAGQVGTHKSSVMADVSVLAELGEKEKALDLLDQGAAKGDFWLFTVKTDPFMEPLRGDPRFQAISKKFDAPA
jgi:TolB-like protein/Tfp pilus assembly protein PilF